MRNFDFSVKMMNRQLIAVAQVIFSVAAGFTFGFFGLHLTVGGLEFGVRIFLGKFKFSLSTEEHAWCNNSSVALYF